MANIIFRIPQKFYPLTDFTKETLDKIVEKMWKINKDTGSNECAFYDFEELLTFENLTPETKSLIKQVNCGIECVRIEIDAESHNIYSKRKMHLKPLDTFKGLYLHTIMTSKTYEIENIEESIVKLKGIDKEINLKNVGYKYHIE